nr:hypothetical protein [bacterium]
MMVVLNKVQNIEQKRRRGEKRMAFDYSKLNGKIKEKFGTQAKFAKAMGLSERSVSLKLNGKIFFKQPEIEKACDLLKIREDDVIEYFFKKKVQNIEQNKKR